MWSPGLIAWGQHSLASPSSTQQAAAALPNPRQHRLTAPQRDPRGGQGLHRAGAGTGRFWAHPLLPSLRGSRRPPCSSPHLKPRAAGSVRGQEPPHGSPSPVSPSWAQGHQDVAVGAAPGTHLASSWGFSQNQGLEHLLGHRWPVEGSSSAAGCWERVRRTLPTGTFPFLFFFFFGFFFLLSQPHSAAFAPGRLRPRWRRGAFCHGGFVAGPGCLLLNMR